MRNKKLVMMLVVMVLILVIVGCGNTKPSSKDKAQNKESQVQTETDDEQQKGKLDKETEENIPNVEGEKAEQEEETSVQTTAKPENTQSTQSTQSTEQATEKVTMYAKSGVNVRSGAGTSNPKVGSLTKGQQVVKIGETNGWSKIEFNGKVGYVNSKYLSAQKVSTSTTNGNVGNSNNGAVNNSGSSNVGSVKPSTPKHEHEWEAVKKGNYKVIENYIYGCNGCGYPLFTITENGAQNIENLYFHPPCYSERLGGDCTGGGFHSESYTSGYCGLCGEKVSYRQCMWTENGKRCIKNEAAGSYEKVEFSQNYFMYFDACDCGMNSIIIDGNTGDGIVFDYDVCKICGVTKKPYE